MVTFIQHFRHYLYGQRFVVRTDHASLCWLKNFKNAEGMLGRWLAVIDTYDFELVHRKGIYHTNADAMSRRPCCRCGRDECPDCMGLNICVVTPRCATIALSSTSQDDTVVEL